jgi:hypothetical protein
MKKQVCTSLFLSLLCFSLSAQYKKASFFDKEGRTYSLGSQLYAMGDGKGSPVGFAVTFGRDRDDKQFFSSWDLQMLPSYKFSFTTTDENDNTITVNGKAKMHLIYGVNYGYFLLKNDKAERKVKPYLSAGFNIVLLGGAKEISDNNSTSYNKKAVADQNFSAGIKGGLGCLLALAPKFSLKLDGGYNYQFNISSESFSDVKAYHLFSNHPFVSAGIRYRIVKE